jgi:hypothetical protein
MSIQNHSSNSRAQVLVELRNEMKALLGFGDALDAKLNTLIGSGSLILGLFSTFGLVQFGPPWYWTVIIASSIVYLGSLFYLGIALKPTTYHFPIWTDWNHLYTTYIPLGEDDVSDLLISQLIEAIEKNQEVLTRKARAVSLGVWMLLAMLVMLAGCRLLLAIHSATP